MKNINQKFKQLLFYTIIALLFYTNLFAGESFFNEAKEKFDQKKFEDSKFLFQRNIVYNPKDAKSYLYLAKIFEEKEDEVYEELNLNTVLLLNPKNEEAIYMLMQLKIKQSNFSATKELLKKFNLVCVSICSKNKKIEKKLESLSP